MSRSEGKVRAEWLGTWLCLCLGSSGAPVSKKEEVVLSSGSPQAMNLWLSHLHLLLRNTIPLEIWELQPGGCAPPNAIPMGAPALLSSPRHPRAASPGVL